MARRKDVLVEVGCLESSRNALLLSVLLPTFALACRTTGPSEGGISTSPSSDLAMGASRSAPASPSPESSVSNWMKDHDRRGAAVRDAVARGDLEAAKHEAATLAGLRLEAVPDASWNPKLEAIRAAAARIANSADLDSASGAAAQLAKACRDCHVTVGGPKSAAAESSASTSGVRATMLRHQWAATRLWEGLVIPSDDDWKAGARTLSDQSIAPELLTPGKTPVPKIGQLAESLRDLARGARAAQEVDARVEVYGQMLATCAKCHAWLGGGPPP